MILNIKTFQFGKHGPDNPEKLVGKEFWKYDGQMPLNLGFNPCNVFGNGFSYPAKSGNLVHISINSNILGKPIYKGRVYCGNFLLKRGNEAQEINVVNAGGAILYPKTMG